MGTNSTFFLIANNDKLCELLILIRSFNKEQSKDHSNTKNNNQKMKLKIPNTQKLAAQCQD